MAELSPVEQQFIILRRLFQVHHRHLSIWRSRELLTDELRCRLLQLTAEIVQSTGTDITLKLSSEIKNINASTEGLNEKVDDLLERLYQHSLRTEFLILKDFMFSERPFVTMLDGATNRFAAKFVGMTEASYALARISVGREPIWERIGQEGLHALYEPCDEQFSELRRSLQRLWISPFDDELW